MARQAPPVFIGKHDDKVMRYISSYWSEYCLPPTVREIHVHCGLASASQVRPILNRLERRGLIVAPARRNMSRTILPTWVCRAVKDAAQNIETGNKLISRGG